MRGLAGLVVLIALVLPMPGGVAQGLIPPPGVSMQAQTAGIPIQPLAAAQSIPITTDITCDPTLVAQGMDISYAISRIPSWAQGTMSPAKEHVPADLCQGGHVILHSALVVRASDQAPAFYPEGVQIEAFVADAVHAPASGRLGFPIAAGYHSILDAQVPTSVFGVRPGGAGGTVLKMSNLGNGNTKIFFEVENVNADLVVKVPDPIILESKPSGGTHIQQLVPMAVYRQSGSAGATETFSLRWRSAYALDAGLAGDTGVMTFTVTSANDTVERASLPEPVKQVPAPSMILVGVGIVVAAFAWRRAAP